MAHPKLKFLFDVLFLAGVLLLVIKLAVLLLNKVADMDIGLYGGKLFWNFGSLLFMVVGGVASGILKEKYKRD